MMMKSGVFDVDPGSSVVSRHSGKCRSLAPIPNATSDDGREEKHLLNLFCLRPVTIVHRLFTEVTYEPRRVLRRIQPDFKDEDSS